MTYDKYKKIYTVIPGSIADEIGLKPGDIVVTINGQDFNDIIDYQFLISDEYLELEVLKASDKHCIYEIHKEYDEDLGIQFKHSTISPMKKCMNKCIFCFIDQMPPNLRSTLYVKDDDYRMSFFHGNFVTLTNLTQDDVNRIIRLHMSPLYVSVHTTNGKLRQKMMANPKASKIMDQLIKLTQGGIEVHCQIVLCPGINDGEELEKSIQDLISLRPRVKSLAIVPVGLTKYREGLFPIQKIDKNKALEVISQVRKWQQYCKDEFNYNFVFLSDEFYLLGGLDTPPYSHYEDFPQIENGVGLIALFRHSLQEAYKKIPHTLHNKQKVSIATGELAYDFLKKAVEPFKQINNLQIEVFPVTNIFFGKGVTVAGLVTGRDLISQLKSKDLGNRLLIPETMLKERQDVFIDNITVKDVEKKLGVAVCVVKIDGKDLLNKIIQGCR